MSEATAPAPEPAPPPRLRRLWPAFAWTSLAMALPLALALALAALMWAAGTASGTAWLLGQVPGLSVAAPQGSLLGGLSAERLEIALPGPSGTDRIVVSGLRLQGLSLGWSVAESAWARLGIDRLRADRVDVLLTPDPNAPPLALPQSLQLPIELELRALDIGELHAAALGERPLLGLHAELHLQAGSSRLHRIDALSLAWDRIAVRGAGTIASVAPFDVDARLTIEPRAAATGSSSAVPTAPAAFDASLTARGPLDKLAVQATLRGALPAGPKGAEAPSLDLSASVLPFAPWPLGALQASTRALDLAALHSSAPGTSISGSADVASQGTDRLATVAVTLTNARAGRIDEGLLPLRSLNADIRARPDDPQQVEIHALDLVLGTARAAGGRIQGSGRWTPQRATLTATLTDIAPSVLDARAPETRLSGTAELTADGGFESSPRTGTAPSLVLRSRIAGNLPHSGRQERLQLELDTTVSANRVELRRATLQAGDSRATLSGQALRQGRGWQVRGQGTLADFNPALWWPGEEGSAWRKGPHRFNGTLDLDGLVPLQAGAQALSLQRLATTQGQATLRVTDSLLAGSALSGELALRGEGAAGLNVNGALAVAGTALALRGRLDADARDHWEIDVKAADLATWAPLRKLMQPANTAVPALAGALDAQAAFDGRWPQLASTGRVELKNARASTLRLQRGALRWAVSTAAQAPLEVQAEVDQFALPEAPGSPKLPDAPAGGRTPQGGGLGATQNVQKLDSLRLSVQGTAAEHRIVLSAASPVQPPRWIDLLHGADASVRAAEAATGTLAEFKAQGGLQFDTAWQKPLRWKGRFQQLDAKRRGGGLPTPWFHVGETEIDAQYDPLTRTPQVLLSAGRAELPNLALRWSQLRWKGGSAPLLDVQAEVEPFSIAPLLARLQPDFGWGGDLVLAGKVNVQSAPSFIAEIEFGRLQGDLHVTDESGTQPLELTDLRVALDARDGVWNFTQALAGKTLGAMAGAATVRTDARALWPPASAPLEGVLEARIANLGSWGAWVPAGWRLRGALHASASLGGKFGAPEYTGLIDGSGLGVRNLLEGVDLHDGELEIALKGETAQIGKLRARAGDGGLQISGDADFGEAPKAKLRVVADKMLLLGRVDRRIVTSGEASLQFDPRSLVVDGRFNIDQGLFDFSRGNAPTLGNDVIVIREPVTTVAEAAAPRPASARDVKVNLVLNLGSALRARGRGLDTRLKGELLLSAPNGRLAVNGTVNAVDGTYAAYGQNLTIERGAVTFSGAIENPRLDILALRPNLDILVGVAITGSASTPRIALFSEPDLPDNEKLSWLVLGRAPEGLQGSDTALLQAAAMALLAGEGDGLGSELARLNPLDTLSVRQTDGEVRNTIVSVGKQLSQRWYIGYERSLTATAGNWQLIYRLAQRFTVRLQAGLDNSIDLIWSWRWD